MEYDIMQAPVITGTFDNVAFGSRVAVRDGDNTSGAIGSFVVNYDAAGGRVFLSDFQPALPTVVIDRIRWTGSQLVLEWTVSDGGAADVFFSPSLIGWGAPIATGILAGTFTHFPVPALPEGFYMVLPTGVVPLPP